MTDSRVKRKSMRNLSESSSLRDLFADGNSSIIKSLFKEEIANFSKDLADNYILYMNNLRHRN